MMKTAILSRTFILLRILLYISISQIISGQTIENNYITIRFDKENGQLYGYRKDGQVLFAGNVNGVTTPDGTYTSESRNYRYTVRRVIDDNKIPELLIYGKDKKKSLDFVNRISLPEKTRAIQFEVTYTNVSGRDINVRSLTPVRLTGQNGAGLYFKNARKCLTNGAMYYDAGMICDLDKPCIKPEYYGETKGGVPVDTALTSNPRTILSWWNTALFNDYNTESISAGYLLNENSLGRIQVLKTSDSDLSLIIESVFNPGFVLKESQSISSDKCVLVFGTNPSDALESYACLMADEMKNPAGSIINGWCNWFYTMDSFDENEILKNAEFAARELKPYGLEYIQIDEGYQRLHGEWHANNRFPHGLKWFCDQVKALGLKPGIWIAPFIISENTDVFKQHPDWLLKDNKGEPARVGPWPSTDTEWYRTETPKRYCLDISHPDAERWFTDLIDTIVNNWGFEMIKVDFVAWSVFSATQFCDPGVTPAMMYRKSMKIMRMTAGDKCHILDCGPGQVSGGYINSMRVEYDQNYGYAGDAWKQYFGGYSCSAAAAGKRYFFHNKAWINDIDHVCIDLLPEINAEAAATLVGLSGGNLISGDRLMNLSRTKTEILKKIFPSTIEQEIPVDLLENDPQRVFSCHVEKEFGSWDLIAFFNPDQERSITVKYDLKRLRIDDTKSYLCFDFWKERFAGEVSGNIEVTVDPGSVVLYSLHEKTSYPQILSTNRHIKQGAVELESEYYDIDAGTLSARSVSPPGTSHSVYVYLPDGYGWAPADRKVFEYQTNYTIRRVDENILRVDVFFNDTNVIDWIINFKEIK